MSALKYWDSTTSTWKTVSGNAQGVPTGGTASQILAKIDATDYNTQWITQTGGGNVSNVAVPTAGQIAAWTDATHIQGIPNAMLQWDGGATSLNAANGRNNLGGTALGQNLFTVPNVGSATRFFRTDSASANLVVTETAPLHLDALGATVIGHAIFIMGAPALDGFIGIAAIGPSVVQRSFAQVRSDLSLNNVTNDVQTQAAVVPNTAPSPGNILIGSAVGNYTSQAIFGAAAYMSATLGAGGQLTVNGITNAALANNDIQIGNTGSRTALGGGASLDVITGLSAQPVGLIKRTAANAMGIATAGTDYQAPMSVTRVAVYASGTGTHNTSAGCRAMLMECVGGGGAGGGGATSSSNASVGAGGGAGAYVSNYVTSPQATYNWAVGAGGTAGTAGNAGNNGGDTNFGTVAIAKGGLGGGVMAAGTTVAQVQGSTGGLAGGCTGDLRVSGGHGGSGFRLSTTTPFMAFGGEGGAGFFGNGGPAQVATTGGNAGQAGLVTGSGGSGGATITTSCVGGVGVAGMIRITEYF